MCAMKSRVPYERLSALARHEAHRKSLHRPPYYLHKWWARRTGDDPGYRLGEADRLPRLRQACPAEPRPGRDALVRPEVAEPRRLSGVRPPIPQTAEPHQSGLPRVRAPLRPEPEALREHRL